MKRFFDLNKLTDNNFCDNLESYMVEIPDDNKPYGLVNGKVEEISKTPEYIANQVQKRKGLFYSQFIKTSKGCIRLKTAIGDFISVLPNYSFEVMSTGKLPTGRILFYNEPTFLSDDEELVSYPSEEMTSAEYMALYMEIQAEYQKIFNKG